MVAARTRSAPDWLSLGIFWPLRRHAMRQVKAAADDTIQRTPAA
jgi:hypothetical protein